LSGVTANDNGFAGISLLGSELAQFFGSGANVFKMNNNLFGFFMPAGAILSPYATAKFNATNNQLDINAQFGSRITFDNVDNNSVVCDQTVLVRGSLVCPTQP
jgi:hypothetical protein